MTLLKELSFVGQLERNYTMSFTKLITCDYCGDSITIDKDNENDEAPTDWIILEISHLIHGTAYNIHACQNCAPTLIPTKVHTAWTPPKKRGKIATGALDEMKRLSTKKTKGPKK